jgi:hypothetical protein
VRLGVCGQVVELLIDVVEQSDDYILVQPGEKKNPFCVRPSWHIMTPYAQISLPEE